MKSSSTYSPAQEQKTLKKAKVIFAETKKIVAANKENASAKDIAIFLIAANLRVPVLEDKNFIELCSKQFNNPHIHPSYLETFSLFFDAMLAKKNNRGDCGYQASVALCLFLFKGIDTCVTELEIDGEGSLRQFGSHMLLDKTISHSLILFNHGRTYQGGYYLDPWSREEIVPHTTLLKTAESLGFSDKNIQFNIRSRSTSNFTADHWSKMSVFFQTLKSFLTRDRIITLKPIIKKMIAKDLSDCYQETMIEQVLVELAALLKDEHLTKELESIHVAIDEWSAACEAKMLCPFVKEVFVERLGFFAQDNDQLKDICASAPDQITELIEEYIQPPFIPS